MGTAPVASPATISDLLALDPSHRGELIRGTIIDKPEASTRHTRTAFSTGLRLGERFQRRPGTQPGGWWFFSEQLVRFGPDVVRPDVCGFRRERMPVPPDVTIIELAPDWTCEILSPSHEARDRIDKVRTYYRGGVPHYWIMNAEERVLEVYRRTDIGFALVLTAGGGEKVSAEPFEAVELAVDELFGDDPTEP